MENPARRLCVAGIRPPRLAVSFRDALLADMRQAVRALRSNRGVAFVAVRSLGLGIGANTAIFSLINAMMLKSVPVSRPETLLKVTMGKDSRDTFTNPIVSTLPRAGKRVESRVSG